MQQPVGYLRQAACILFVMILRTVPALIAGTILFLLLPDTVHTTGVVRIRLFILLFILTGGTVILKTILVGHSKLLLK